MLEAEELKEAVKGIYTYLEVAEDNIASGEAEWVEILEDLFDKHGLLWDIKT